MDEGMFFCVCVFTDTDTYTDIPHGLKDVQTASVCVCGHAVQPSHMPK